MGLSFEIRKPAYYTVYGAPKTKRKRRNKKEEENLQLIVCRYIALQYQNALFRSDLSGIKLTIGQAVKVKKLRSSNAFPDLEILEPRGGYCGLHIELKKPGERITKKDGTPASQHLAEQTEMIEKLIERGYYAIFCDNFDDAKSIIDKYLTNKIKKHEI